MSLKPGFSTIISDQFVSTAENELKQYHNVFIFQYNYITPLTAVVVGRDGNIQSSEIVDNDEKGNYLANDKHCRNNSKNKQKIPHCRNNSKIKQKIPHCRNNSKIKQNNTTLSEKF